MATTAPSLAAKLQTPYHPEVVTISLGLRQLAFSTYRNCVEDAQGRGPHDKDQRRKDAARALHWLRDHESTEPFSLNWCSELLGVDAHWLAFNGVARIPRSGLQHWRIWRKHRNGNRARRYHESSAMRSITCGEGERKAQS